LYGISIMSPVKSLNLFVSLVKDISPYSYGIITGEYWNSIRESG